MYIVPPLDPEAENRRISGWQERLTSGRSNSRTARLKLKPRKKPYPRSIAPELQLCYRKFQGRPGGSWLVSYYVGDRTYETQTFAYADDVAPADGVKVLNYDQALERARSLYMTRVNAGGATGPYTVAAAIAAYLDHLHGRASRNDTEKRLKAYVPKAIADKEVDELTKDEIIRWHRKLADSPPRARTKRGAAKQNFRAINLDDPEAVRRRKVSANRILALLKAALNHAVREGKVASDRAWRHVAPFKGVSAARIRYLSIAEAKRLINASDVEFRKLVRAALETGCRYQELNRLRVEDFNADAGTLQIRLSKSGKSRHVVLTDEGAAFFAQLTAGRAGADLMFGREWRPSAQARPMKAACERARIDPPVGFHQLRHTWASHAVMANVPLPVVARNLGHSDTRMVEKHYGHLAQDYISDAIRKGAPRFGEVEEKSNVRRHG